MFNSIETTLNFGKIIQYQITDEQKKLSFIEVIRLLKSSQDFRFFFTELLNQSEFEAFFWEVKKLTKHTLNDHFEFVLVNSSILSNINANKSAFREHFKTNQSVVSFPNLGGDAILIVPTQECEEQNYAHLSIFLRNAPAKQIDQFWQLTGEKYEQSIGAGPKWLSTAGLGVSWLHVRIDSYPKYYRYGPYRKN